MALGLAFNSQKLYAEAKPPLLRSLEIEPDDLEALAALAESEEGLGELEAAERTRSACWRASQSTPSPTW